MKSEGANGNVLPQTSSAISVMSVYERIHEIICISKDPDLKNIAKFKA